MASLLLAPASAALAYIGPGAGISVVGSLLSILATFFVAIGAIIFWPLRKFMRRRRARRELTPGAEPAQSSDAGEGDENSGDDHRV